MFTYRIATRNNLLIIALQPFRIHSSNPPTIAIIQFMETPLRVLMQMIHARLIYDKKDDIHLEAQIIPLLHK